MAATASPLCSRKVLSATFLSNSSSFAIISTSAAFILTAANSFSLIRMAFQSASADAAMEAMASWTRVESSWRSSTRSVSLSKALLCCCMSLESSIISTPSSAPSMILLLHKMMP
uniref:Uncharacterized protein n=1 Tax=Lotus japonicus TaxID=34305 RepID=I3STA7_LOTJA|nr:unknown [Lotus japonicus]